jgi:hypothetical protein
MAQEYYHIGVAIDRGYETYVYNLIKTSIKFYTGTTPLLFEVLTNDFDYSFSKITSLDTGDHKVVLTYADQAYHDKYQIPFDFKKKYLLPDDKINALKKLNVDLKEENTLKALRFMGNVTSPYKKYVIFDADMLVAGDLKEIFEFDLKDNYVASCKSYFYSSNDQTEAQFNNKVEEGLVANRLAIQFSLFNVPNMQKDMICHKILEVAQQRLDENIDLLFNGYSNYIGSAAFFGTIFSELVGSRIDFLPSTWAYDAHSLRDDRLNDGGIIDYFKSNAPKLYHFSSRNEENSTDTSLLAAENVFIKKDYYNTVLDNLLND